MNSGRKRDLEQKRENYPTGHGISYKFSASNLPLLRTWPFKKTYTTDCEISPTSWELKVEFLKVREDASASFSATLKRTDFQFTAIAASVLVQISDLRSILLFPRQSFGGDIMFPGDVLQETVEISPLPNKKEEIHDSIIVDIFLMVRYCHGDSNTDGESSEKSHSE